MGREDCGVRRCLAELVFLRAWVWWHGEWETLTCKVLPRVLVSTLRSVLNANNYAIIKVGRDLLKSSSPAVHGHLSL